MSEFSRLLKKVDPDLSEEEVALTFTIFDKNNDNTITFNEFFETLQQISIFPNRSQNSNFTPQLNNFIISNSNLNRMSIFYSIHPSTSIRILLNCITPLTHFYNSR